MIISLLGYMGTGKSHISKILSEKLKMNLKDLDEEISNFHQKNVSEIFLEKGELFFRKEEKKFLEKVLQEENTVISLGGGTPVYYDNIRLIKEKSRSVFLQTSVGELTKRLLKEKHKRPLLFRIPDEDLPEYIAKHLFERNVFYQQAETIINTDNKSAEEICDEIIAKIL